MGTENKTCAYTANKDDPSGWHGERWVLDQDTWECPHDQLDERKYCVFHTPPDNMPYSSSINEVELFVKAINEASTNGDDDLARRKKEFIGANFGRFELPEGTFLDAGDDHPIRLTHATFFHGLTADEVTFEHPIRADMTQFGKSEDKVSFQGTDFSGEGDVSFSSADFSGEGDVVFLNADFSGKGDMTFTNADFSGESHVSFSKADFSGEGDLMFKDADFSGKGGTAFANADFSGEGDVSFSGTNFSSEGNVMFGAADFSGKGNIEFRGTDFSVEGSVSFSNADFSGEGDVSFTGVDFSVGGDVMFRDTNFSGEGDMSFEGADLSRATLKDADFLEMNLQYADFTAADLRGTDLSRSDLREANLSDTKMSGATECGQLRRAEDNALKSEDWDAIARSYHALSSRFSEHGLVGKARQHHILERKARGKEARYSGDTSGVIGSLASRWITGYGVNYIQVLYMMALLFVPSTLVYFHSGIENSLLYSVITFTTAPPEPPPTGFPEVVAMVETFLGTLLVVLLGYVLGNRESF